MEKAITVRGREFKYSAGWYFRLQQYDIITPIWKRGKCVRLLITKRKTGESFYVDANTREIVIYISVNVLHTPQGITYLLNQNADISVLNTMISFREIIEVDEKSYNDMIRNAVQKPVPDIFIDSIPLREYMNVPEIDISKMNKDNQK